MGRRKAAAIEGIQEGLKIHERTSGAIAKNIKSVEKIRAKTAETLTPPGLEPAAKVAEKVGAVGSEVIAGPYKAVSGASKKIRTGPLEALKQKVQGP